jgi:outer membrane lipoprotein-sorting protein
MKKTNLSLVMLALLLVVLAACESESGEKPENNVEAQNNQAASNDNSNEVNNEVQEESNDAAKEIKSIFAKQANVQFMVKYDVTTTANGETMESVMTQYIKGVDKMRIDMIAEGMETQTFLDGQTYHMCNKATGDWMCLKIEYEASESDEIQKDVEENVENYKVTKLASRTIAGASTSCYLVETENGNVEYCYTADGVPLYVKTTGSAQGQSFTSELIATQYSKTVSDSVFERPAESQDMGNLEDLMKQYQ